jgi:LPXTG-motif cell wall-anchored protein
MSRKGSIVMRSLSSGYTNLRIAALVSPVIALAALGTPALATTAPPPAPSATTPAPGGDYGSTNPGGGAPAPGNPAQPAPGKPAEPVPGKPAPGKPAEPAPGKPAKPAPGYPAPVNPAPQGKGKIEGRIWNDANGNGIQDRNENGVPNAVVRLVHTPGGLRGTGPAVATTHRTNSHGFYTFTDVAPETADHAYDLTAAAPGTGWTWTKTSVGAESADSDLIALGTPPKPFPAEFPAGAPTAISLSVSVKASQSTVLDGGLVPAPAKPGKPQPRPVPATGKPGVITGRVWNDANHNGVQDKGEKGVKDATVVLVHSPGGVQGKGTPATTVHKTDGNGYYSFGGLTPATGDHEYVLAMAAPAAGWTWTKTDVGNDARDSDVTPYGTAPAVYSRYFAKGAATAYVLQADVRAGQTTHIDGGLIGSGKDTDTLPVTGASVTWLATGGSMLLAGGLALLVLTRRRRTA